MLSGPSLILRPRWAREFDGVAEGLVYEQLRYRIKSSELTHEDRPALRSSYTRLQRQLPFYTRRWIMEIVRRLQSTGTIEVVNTKRVNLFVLNDAYEYKVKSTGQNSAAMLLFPALACKVGVLEAVALQQIHLRHYFADGHHWAIRSLSRWQSESFMFIGIATVQRLFARLRQEGLVLVRSYADDAGHVNSYRVNYVKVAEVLGLPTPVFKTPQGEDAEDWLDPFHPMGPTANPAAIDAVSTVH